MKTVRALVLVAVVAAMALPLPTGAQQRAFQIITPYPAVTVQAGKTVTLNIEVIAPSRQRVDLAVVDVPAGWQATLRGGGFVINGVFAGPKAENETPPQVQLEIRVPPDAAQGDYRMAVRGTAGGASDTLAINVQISEVAAGAVTLTPEFPTLRGSATDTFRFTITLNNNTPERTTFNLAAQGPEGWTVDARPTTQERATTVAVEGGQTANFEVNADPPNEVTAGEYPIKVTASGGGHNAETDLKVEITGNLALTLTTPDERLSAEAIAGRGTNITLVVGNDGSSPLNDVSVSGTPPTGWRVTFSPERVAAIAPKQSANVTARLTPSGEAVAGDYVVTFNASAQGTSGRAEIRVTVKTSPLWGFLGIFIIAVALGGLYWVYQRYGRR